MYALGDVGFDEADGSAQPAGRELGALPVMQALTRDALRGLQGVESGEGGEESAAREEQTEDGARLVLHVGDISYAMGFAAQWEVNRTCSLRRTKWHG